MSIESFSTDEALTERLQVVLQEWPLYRAFVYAGAGTVRLVPPYISLFCDNCNTTTFWQTKFGQYEDFPNGFIAKEYICRNCGKGSTRYYLYWARADSRTIFFKVGQYPELEERVSSALKDALTLDDLQLYKHALRLRNFNLGIASVAYMRRVVENRMNDLLEILYQAARVHNAPAAILTKHDEVMKDRRFATKVDYAGDLLPRSLRPDGHPNPMAVLHELASDGLHSKSDEECVDIFDACRQTFEYVFGKMRIETEEAKTFIQGMAKLAEKRTRAASKSTPPVDGK